MASLEEKEIREDGGYGGVHCRLREMLEPAAAFLKEVAILIARIVGSPEDSQSAI